MMFNQMMMDIAYRVAQQSIDPDRKVGAVLVKDSQILGYGWNGTPNEYFTNECKHTNGKTRQEVVHAEMNAIAKAATSSVSLAGSTIFSTTIPCIDCAKMIVQCGINTVYYTEEYNKCSKGRQLIIDCGLELIKLED